MQTDHENNVSVRVEMYRRQTGHTVTVFTPLFSFTIYGSWKRHDAVLNQTVSLHLLVLLNMRCGRVLFTCTLCSITCCCGANATHHIRFDFGDDLHAYNDSMDLLKLIHCLLEMIQSADRWQGRAFTSTVHYMCSTPSLGLNIWLHPVFKEFKASFLRNSRHQTLSVLLPQLRGHLNMVLGVDLPRINATAVHGILASPPFRDVHSVSWQLDIGFMGDGVMEDYIVSGLLEHDFKYDRQALPLLMHHYIKLYQQLPLP